MKFDVIGDVHGHHAPLVELLEELGYACRNGVYRNNAPSISFKTKPNAKPNGMPARTESGRATTVGS
jgi:hypothetical protein